MKLPYIIIAEAESKPYNVYEYETLFEAKQAYFKLYAAGKNPKLYSETEVTVYGDQVYTSFE